MLLDVLKGLDIPDDQAAIDQQLAVLQDVALAQSIDTLKQKLIQHEAFLKPKNPALYDGVQTNSDFLDDNIEPHLRDLRQKAAEQMMLLLLQTKYTSAEYASISGTTRPMLIRNRLARITNKGHDALTSHADWSTLPLLTNDACTAMSKKALELMSKPRTSTALDGLSRMVHGVLADIIQIKNGIHRPATQQQKDAVTTTQGGVTTAVAAVDHAKKAPDEATTELKVMNARVLSTATGVVQAKIQWLKAKAAFAKVYKVAAEAKEAALLSIFESNARNPKRKDTEEAKNFTKAIRTAYFKSQVQADKAAFDAAQAELELVEHLHNSSVFDPIEVNVARAYLEATRTRFEETNANNIEYEKKKAEKYDRINSETEKNCKTSIKEAITAALQGKEDSECTLLEKMQARNQGLLRGTEYVGELFGSDLASTSDADPSSMNDLQVAAKRTMAFKAQFTARFVSSLADSQMQFLQKQLPDFNEKITDLDSLIQSAEREVQDLSNGNESIVDSLWTLNRFELQPKNGEIRRYSEEIARLTNRLDALGQSLAATTEIDASTQQALKDARLACFMQEGAYLARVSASSLPKKRVDRTDFDKAIAVLQDAQRKADSAAANKLQATQELEQTQQTIVSDNAKIYTALQDKHRTEAEIANLSQPLERIHSAQTTLLELNQRRASALKDLDDFNRIFQQTKGLKDTADLQLSKAQRLFSAADEAAKRTVAITLDPSLQNAIDVASAAVVQAEKENNEAKNKAEQALVAVREATALKQTAEAAHQSAISAAQEAALKANQVGSTVEEITRAIAETNTKLALISNAKASFQQSGSTDAALLADLNSIETTAKTTLGEMHMLLHAKTAEDILVQIKVLNIKVEGASARVDECLKRYLQMEALLKQCKAEADKAILITDTGIDHERINAVLAEARQQIKGVANLIPATHRMQIEGRIASYHFSSELIRKGETGKAVSSKSYAGVVLQTAPKDTPLVYEGQILQEGDYIRTTVPFDACVGELHITAEGAVIDKTDTSHGQMTSKEASALAMEQAKAILEDYDFRAAPAIELSGGTNEQARRVYAALLLLTNHNNNFRIETEHPGINKHELKNEAAKKRFVEKYFDKDLRIAAQTQQMAETVKLFHQHIRVDANRLHVSEQESIDLKDPKTGFKRPPSP